MAAVRPVSRVAAACWHWALRTWRANIQLRVVATTLVVSAVVIAILGLLLMNQIAHGLVTTKRNQALDEAKSGQRYAAQQLQTLNGPSDPALDSTLRMVVVNLSTRGAETADFAVAISTHSSRLPRLYLAQFASDTLVIPRELSDVVGKRKPLAYKYVSTSLDGGTHRPFLVVGTALETAAGQFQLYYFFPLDAESRAIDLVRKALLGTGILLALLLTGIAWVVTHQVVTPVRLAARTASRLSAGMLEERMKVHGTDDLAQLAQAFNQMAANLQSQIVQLEDLSRLQRRFTSDVSHELRTPLTTVRMAAEILYSKRNQFSIEAARSSELLVAELDRFEALLADLLEISRYDSGFAVLEPEPTDIAVLIDRVLAGLRPLAERNHIQLQTVIPSSRIVADVDPRRIERVLRNLVGNALEYAEGRPVVVRLAANSEAVAVAVRDYGVGLRPADVDSVFTRFWRADPSRARQTGGTGLGLAIAWEDARLHGGTLQAWGRPGYGTQFLLTVPLHVGTELDSSPIPLRPSDVDDESSS